MFEKDKKNIINEKKLGPYLNIIKDLKNLGDIRNNKKLEDSILEKVYKSNIRPDKTYGNNYDIRRIRVRPAFLKPVIVFLSVLLFFSLSFAGTIYASANSLPGDALYNVKRTYENVQIVFTPYANEGKLYFNFLNKRIYEVDTLLNREGTIDEETIENLLSEIDYNYGKCMEHNSFGKNEGNMLGRRIDGLRETFHKRRGNKYNSGYSNGTCNQNLDQPQNNTTQNTIEQIDDNRQSSGQYQDGSIQNMNQQHSGNIQDDVETQYGNGDKSESGLK